MSIIIASAGIRGAHKIVGKAEKKWKEAMDKWGANEPVGFPNTAYYLPIIYGITGTKVEKAIEDVTLKQIKILQEWEKENPNYLEDPKLIHTWNLLVHNIMSGADAEERERNKKNIKKKVGETIIIKDAIADI